MIAHYSIFIFVLCIILISCKKPEESKNWTEVHVVANNYVTGEPLNDIYIGIIERKQKFFTSESKSISEGYTDEIGEYYFGWKARGNSKYSYEYIAQANPGKYHIINFQQVDYLIKGQANMYSIDLIPKAEFKFIYENQNCFDITDTMWFKIDHELIQYQSEDWNPFPRIGCYSYNDPDIYSFPIGTYEITMKIKRDGVVSYIYLTETLNEGETKTIEMFY